MVADVMFVLGMRKGVVQTLPFRYTRIWVWHSNGGEYVSNFIAFKAALSIS